jgi:zinc transport system substrate-binding protein
LKHPVLFSTCMIAAIVMSNMVAAVAKTPNVVVSIKPIHSIVTNIMKGVGKPVLIIEGAGSPHNYALKPSQAASLEKADLVFWVGHKLEAFLEKPINTIARKATSIELMNSSGLKLLQIREGVNFAAHDDDSHGASNGHKDHLHEKLEAKVAHKNDHDEHVFDHHIWLDPVNAKALISAITNELVKADPTNRQIYQANATAADGEISRLIDDVTSTLAIVKERRFVVFHDAYHYFERRFGMAAIGSITVSPEVMPGAARLSDIRAGVKNMGAKCIFSEPQFEPKIVSMITKETGVNAGILDPLGASIDAGPDHYIELIRNLALSFHECLSK